MGYIFFLDKTIFFKLRHKQFADSFLENELGRYFGYIWIVSQRGHEAKLIAELTEQERRNTRYNERSIPFWKSSHHVYWRCRCHNNIIFIYNLTQIQRTIIKYTYDVAHTIEDWLSSREKRNEFSFVCVIFVAVDDRTIGNVHVR